MNNQAKPVSSVPSDIVGKRLKGLYENKDRSYYSHTRLEVVNMVKGKNLKILEIGCGTGDMLAYMKEKKIAKEAVGIEIEETAAKKAATVLDKVFVENVETFTIPYKKYFDYVIFADVLEHMLDPWDVLARMQDVLKDDGRVVISIPNIRNMRVLKDLVMDGDWKQHTNSGSTDRTHLRFFTWKTLSEMVNNAGFTVEERSANQTNSWKHKAFDSLTMQKFADLKIRQFIIRIKKTPGGKKKKKND